MSVSEIDSIQSALQKFAQDRDWEQFHTPKNLAMALAVESSELLELFQWLTPEQSQHLGDDLPADRVQEELADVLIYLLRLADVLSVDLVAAVGTKLEANARKYPVDEVQGSARKR